MSRMSRKKQASQEAYCITLPEIFQYFTPLVIPAYQRCYAWEDKHIKDLIQDMEDVKRFSSDEHFTGTIVLSEDRECYLIVDGQQRLTSLFILIKAIYDKTEDKKLLEKYIVKKEKHDSKSRLSTRNDSNNFFEEFVVKNNLNVDAEIYSHKRIKAAKKLFDDWLADKSSDYISDILNIIEHKFKFIVYKPKNSLNAPAMFEIINNRGKNLSEIEKIKNYFVYLATLVSANHSLHTKISNCWEGLLKNLNRADIHTIDDENNFLRFCFITSFSPSKSKYQNIYATLKTEIFSVQSFSEEEKLDESIDKLDKFLNFMETAAKYYSCIVRSVNCNTAVNNLSDKINLQIKYLACQKNTSSITPLFLAIMSRTDLSEDEKELLLKHLEILNFRMYVLPRILTRSDNGQTALYKAANDFYKKSIDTEGLVQCLKELLSEWSPLTSMVEALLLKDDDGYDFANWGGLKYFLARYEEYLENKQNKTFDVAEIDKMRKDCKSGDYLSVEHIWALQNRIDYADENYIAKRRLGNLVLLELKPNITAGNEDIEKKLKEDNDIECRINIIEKTSLYQGKELKKIFDKVSNRLAGRIRRKNYYRNQGLYIDDEREKKLIKFAIEQWHFEDENTKKAEKLLEETLKNN